MANVTRSPDSVASRTPAGRPDAMANVANTTQYSAMLEPAIQLIGPRVAAYAVPASAISIRHVPASSHMENARWVNDTRRTALHAAITSRVSATAAASRPALSTTPTSVFHSRPAPPAPTIVNAPSSTTPTSSSVRRPSARMGWRSSHSPQNHGMYASAKPACDHAPGSTGLPPVRMNAE
ncbi:MAG: hypothetical protein KDC33_05710 [Thermoleophilia bacterium]|nr:hypothetical protein [Thermoleophilia bacterium]